MRPHQSITVWLTALLPDASPEAREAALGLVQALLKGSGCRLCQIARCVDRNLKARSNRQYLFRWLNRPAWNPPAIYQGLLQLLPLLTRKWKYVPLIMDFTYLSDAYVVLQFSVAFQQRALPLLRLVRAGRGGEGGQQAMMDEALAWLKQHLPGPRSRYVLLGDRGFPSHLFVKKLQKEGWRYVLRIAAGWRMTHPEYAGILQDTVGHHLRPGMAGRWFEQAVFGKTDQGQKEWCRSNVVWCWGPEHQEPWILITSEGDARTARRMYAKRAGIECGFRDVKQGHKAGDGASKQAKVGTGVSWLMKWKSADRVARLLVWVAVREWRLACLWLFHRLSKFREAVEIGGKLSWFRITCEWLNRHPGCAIERLILKHPFYESP